MKKFLRSVLTHAFAMVLAFILLCFLLVVIVAICLPGDTTPLRSDSVLYVHLRGQISERYVEDYYSDYLSSSSSTADDALSSIVGAIRGAASDDRIRGIFLCFDGMRAGYATADEIRQALLEFKRLAPDKFILSYADSYSQKEYYIATTADTLYLNPIGSVDLHGLSATNLYYKNLLDRVGVKVRVFRVGDYKSAVEPYVSTEMSPEARAQTEILLDDLWAHLSAALPDSIAALAERTTDALPADSLLTLGVVSRLAYKDDVLQRLADLTRRTSVSELRVATVSDAAAAYTSDATSAADRIAVVYADGEISGSTASSSSLASGEINATTMRLTLNRLGRDKQVRAVVLRINSPGGSAFASEQIWYAVRRLHDVKPVVVSMGDYAASGGYYIATAADTLLCSPTTITGSIGVFGLYPEAQDALTRLGITHSVVKTHPRADVDDYFSPLTPEDAADLQSSVEQTYRLFRTRVARGRGLSPEAVDSLAGGRVWSGVHALSLGLADAHGTLADAVALAAELAEVSDYAVDEYPQPSAWQRLRSSISTSAIEARVLQHVLGRYAESVATLRELETTLSHDPVRAEIPRLYIE